jgi:hypothetical protein
MRCFVIMPFDNSFDDVYTTIKHAVTSVKHDQPIECMRLDDTRPAGRITERLLSALRDSSFCVADLTDCKPNVMWETGYAMALGKPIIVLTQDMSTLPFDLKDMQALAYDRTQLSKTLGNPLKDIVIDTLVLESQPDRSPSVEDQSRLVISLGVQLAELKEMVGQIVSTWGEHRPYEQPKAFSSKRLRALEGSWKDDESNSHAYIRVIDDYLIGPYCFGGNDQLTAYFYDYQEMGEYLFARFKWLSGNNKGFMFFKQTSTNTFQGSWWYDEDVELAPDKPPAGSGNQIAWHRISARVPKWADNFFVRFAGGRLPITEV